MFGSALVELCWYATLTKFGSRVPHFEMLLNNGAAHQLQNKNDENKVFVYKNQVISYFCKPKE